MAMSTRHGNELAGFPITMVGRVIQAAITIGPNYGRRPAKDLTDEEALHEIPRIFKFGS